MTIRNKIKKTLIAVMEENEIASPKITDETVLLQTGLDSLGFAIVVATLEERLGFGPFVMMDEVVYPSSFKKFVDIHQKNSNK